MYLLGREEPHKVVLNNKQKRTPKAPQHLISETQTPLEPKPKPYHIPEAVRHRTTIAKLWLQIWCSKFSTAGHGESVGQGQTEMQKTCEALP